jgi:hypothetical protein
MSSIIVYGISVPSNKELPGFRTARRSITSPSSRRSTSSIKATCDCELRAAEEGDSNSGSSEQRQGERRGEVTPHNDTIHDNGEGVKPREKLRREHESRLRFMTFLFLALRRATDGLLGWYKTDITLQAIEDMCICCINV